MSRGSKSSNPIEAILGLVPGESTLAQAIERLGHPLSESRHLNATCYAFLGGGVKLTFLDGEDKLLKIWISAKFADGRQVPGNIDEAGQIFGPLKMTRMDKLAGLIYEGSGVRIACDTNPEPAPVRWLEIYAPS